jgi:A/G-specific adenine glycosylase
MVSKRRNTKEEGTRDRDGESMIAVDSMRRALLDWYQLHQRRLPWRQTTDPYAIWVSEIMLQQTQVATVLGYFERFLERFPTIEALANADLSDVHRLWEGLGYYRRATQMHEAAKRIEREYGGRFPDRWDEVRQLPGIGRYTASAIVSFAWDQPYSILEANTQRLYARYIAWEEPLATARSQKMLLQFADRLVVAQGMGQINHALMDLGAMVCTPRKPGCPACPIQRWCGAHRLGKVDRIPAAKPPKVYTELEEWVLLVVDRRGRWLVRQCGEGERWAGLFDFPRFDLTGRESPKEQHQAIAEQAGRMFGRGLIPVEPVGSLRHAVTRYRIELSVWTGRPLAGRWRTNADLLWAAPEELAKLPFSSSGRKIAKWICDGKVRGHKLS